MKVSIIIPVYNEEKVIGNCLLSLANQTVASGMEVVVVNDGSTDNSKFEIQNSKLKNLRFYGQSHLGPGAARNLGASKARGEVLVFVDADMEFEPDFVERLTAPIVKGKAIGTFSKEEYLLNEGNVWARSWNWNLGRESGRMHPEGYPDEQHVFRAILKRKFEEAGGFDTKIGYTDDWSLSRKLGVMARVVPGAKFYHRNPDSLKEVWVQARWFGKNEFLTKNFVRRLYSFWRYLPPLALIKGLVGAVRFSELRYLAFKVVYDTAVFTSVFLAFFGEEKYK